MELMADCMIEMEQMRILHHRMVEKEQKVDYMIEMEQRADCMMK